MYLASWWILVSTVDYSATTCYTTGSAIFCICFENPSRWPFQLFSLIGTEAKVFAPHASALRTCAMNYEGSCLVFEVNSLPATTIGEHSKLDRITLLLSGCRSSFDSSSASRNHARCLQGALARATRRQPCKILSNTWLQMTSRS